MADFSKADGFSTLQNYIRLVFAKGVPLMETEMNELQKIMNHKRNISFDVFTNNGFVAKTTMTLSSGTLTVPADTVCVDGEFIAIAEAMTLELSAVILLLSLTG